MMRFAMFCAAKGRPDPTCLTMSRLEMLADMTKRGARLLTGLA
jgi:hypothetical protein